MRPIIRILLPLALVACRPTPAADPSALDAVARRYVVLGLGLGRHDANYVDAYYGPDSLRAGCVTVDLRPGRQLPAVYDGANAVLVLRPPSGDVQVADLYLCGDTEPRRSITLTAP